MIIILTQCFPSRLGGIESLVSNLALGLGKKEKVMLPLFVFPIVVIIMQFLDALRAALFSPLHAYMFTLMPFCPSMYVYMHMPMPMAHAHGPWPWPWPLSSTQSSVVLMGCRINGV